MKLLTGNSRKFYLNDHLLDDVLWADPETGQAEVYEHTCSRLHPPQRIPAGDNPSGYRTLIVQGAVRVEETVPPPAPVQSSFDWGGGDCYICAMGGMSTCYCGQHVPFPR